MSPVEVLVSAASPGKPAPAVAKARWRFVQTMGVGKPIRFADGTEFTFRLVPLNNGGGFACASEADVDDPRLAEKLRAVAKAGGQFVFEVAKE